MSQDDRDAQESQEERPSQPFRAGLVLDGRYRLERPLAEGGMGAVWVAQQLALERQVAVKVLHATDEAAQARLRHEALALAAVHHPAVVQVYDYGETEAGVPYAVMELVHGESLGAYLRRMGALPAEEAVALVLPLLEGLAAAHQVGIVHRDIKPDNVILAVASSGVAPKLLDFGIARREDVDRLTAEGSLVGTPAYMAPEQVRGGEIDERVDVWAMGVLLYQLIAGETPFAADNVFAVMRSLLDNPPPYPRRARGLNGRLWAILMAALRKDPAERTPSALALREALAGWLGVHEPRAPSTPHRTAPVVVTPPAAVSHLEVTLPAAPDARGAPNGTQDAPVSFDPLIRAKFGDG